MNSTPTPHEQFTEAFYDRRAWLAYGILACNVLFFVLMCKASSFTLRWTLLTGSDHATLINFGAKTNFWVWQQRQWFRFVTPIFLHIGVLHLLTNAYALWIVGPIVERLYGTARFAGMYLLTGMAGIAGSIFSVYLSHYDSPAAGASGALFGMFGMLLVVGFKYRHVLPDTFRQAFGKGVLTVVGINLAFGLLNNFGKSFVTRIRLPLHFVDNGAHIAGLLAGAILALLLPISAPEKRAASGWEKLILGLSVIVVSYCFWRTYQLRPFVLNR